MNAKSKKHLSSYEGRQDNITSTPLPLIETWQFAYAGSATELTIEIPEFTCVCPKTGLPDFATITINYAPQDHCIELKSLKEYIVAFRDLGIFHEHVVNRILADCVIACDPHWMVVTGLFNARGGITTTASAEYDSQLDQLTPLTEDEFSSHLLLPPSVVEESAAPAPKKRGRPPKKKEEVAATPKKRGRPPMKKEEEVAAAPKKRGRPPKKKEEEAAATPKRRGRPPKKKEEKAVTAPKKRGRPKGSKNKPKA